MGQGIARSACNGRRRPRNPWALPPGCSSRRPVLASWPGFSETARRPRAAAPRPDASAAGEVTTSRDADGVGGSILLICGPAGVGKSTIGFQLYLKYLQAGRAVGYIDLDQIGFLSPAADDDPGQHRLKARNRS